MTACAIGVIPISKAEACDTVPLTCHSLQVAFLPLPLRDAQDLWNEILFKDKLGPGA